MDITLKTTFYAIQALLLELKNLREIPSENGSENFLRVIDIENALEELEKKYTAFIEEQRVSNYPSFQDLKSRILDN